MDPAFGLAFCLLNFKTWTFVYGGLNFGIYTAPKEPLPNVFVVATLFSDCVPQGLPQAALWGPISQHIQNIITSVQLSAVDKVGHHHSDATVKTGHETVLNDMHDCMAQASIDQASTSRRLIPTPAYTPG